MTRKAPHLHHELRQRLSALRRQGGAEGTHEGGGRRDHPLVDRLQPGGAGRAARRRTDFETFFAEAPTLNPSRTLITGVVCGVRVEEVEEPLMREIRYLDKLIDELAKGKAMEKILRKAA